MSIENKIAPILAAVGPLLITAHARAQSTPASTNLPSDVTWKF